MGIGIRTGLGTGIGIGIRASIGAGVRTGGAAGVGKPDGVWDGGQHELNVLRAGRAPRTDTDPA